MSETREPLRPGVEGFGPAPDAFERVLVRRDRKGRHRRIAAGILGVAVFGSVAAGFVRLLASEPTPADPEPTQPRNGRWVVFSADHLDPDPVAPRPTRKSKFDLYVAGQTAPLGSSSARAGTRPPWAARPSRPTDRCLPTARRGTSRPAAR